MLRLPYKKPPNIARYSRHKSQQQISISIYLVLNIQFTGMNRLHPPPQCGNSHSCHFLSRLVCRIFFRGFLGTSPLPADRLLQALHKYCCLFSFTKT